MENKEVNIVNIFYQEHQPVSYNQTVGNSSSIMNQTTGTNSAAPVPSNPMDMIQYLIKIIVQMDEEILRLKRTQKRLRQKLARARRIKKNLNILQLLNANYKLAIVNL